MNSSPRSSRGSRCPLQNGVDRRNFLKLMGASAALFQELTFENGRLQQTNFHTFPVMRMNETPEIESYLVDSTEKSGGIGEPGVPCAAPAICNAVFAATGKRIRRLPIRMAEAV